LTIVQANTLSCWPEQSLAMKSPEFELYGWKTPNGQKIIIALEEVGADYLYRPVDITNGEQHTEAFRAISPDGKIPALVHNTKAPVTLFESGAILLYLANKFPILTGNTEHDKAKVMSWTFWQVGQLGPLAGQFGRFHATHPDNSTAIKHFEALVWRCIDVMEKQLTQTSFLAGEQFTVADIAAFPWVASEQSYLQRYNVAWRSQRPALARWAERIASKPSVVKALG